MKDNRRICPHCHKKVSLRKCTYYFLRDSNYSIECNHCHRTIKPIKNPLKVEYCVCAGFLSIYLPAIFYMYIFHMDFLTCILSSLPFTVLVVGVIMVLTLKNFSLFKLTFIK